MARLLNHVTEDQIVCQVRFVGASEIELELPVARGQEDFAATEESTAGQQSRFILRGDARDATVGDRNDGFHPAQECLVIDDHAFGRNADYSPLRVRSR